VTLEQGGEGSLVPFPDEAIQELVVRPFMILPGGSQFPDVPQDGADLCAAHGVASREGDSILLLKEARRGRHGMIFSTRQYEPAWKKRT
jgi:hypothetical protein